jgi:hypothetical protein
LRRPAADQLRRVGYVGKRRPAALAGDVALPPFIDILIGNVVRKARVVWRKSTQIGIEFLEETT